MYTGLHVMYLLFLSDCNQTSTFLTGLKKKLKHKISWKSVHWEPSRVVWIEGHKDGHDEANSRFS